MFCCVRRGNWLVPPGWFSIMWFTISRIVHSLENAVPGLRNLVDLGKIRPVKKLRQRSWKAAVGSSTAWEPRSGTQAARNQGQGNNPAVPGAPQRERKSPRAVSPPEQYNAGRNPPATPHTLIRALIKETARVGALGGRAETGAGRRPAPSRAAGAGNPAPQKRRRAGAAKPQPGGRGCPAKGRARP